MRNRTNILFTLFVIIIIAAISLSLASCGADGDVTDTDTVYVADTTSWEPVDTTTETAAEITGETSFETTKEPVSDTVTVETEAETNPPAKPDTYTYDDGITETVPVVTEPVEPEHNIRDQYFDDAIEKTDKIWYANDDVVYKDGDMSAYPGKCPLVALKTKVTAEVCDISFSLRANVGNDVPWVTSFVGLRCNSYEDNGVADSGVWLAFRNNQIGYLTSTWPDVNYMTIPYSFSDYRNVHIEDRMSEGVIKIYVADDDGDIVYVGKYVITDGKIVSLYNTDDKLQSETMLNHELPDRGYINFWTHLNHNVAFDDIYIEWDDRVSVPYTPVDATKK